MTWTLPPLDLLAPPPPAPEHPESAGHDVLTALTSAGVDVQSVSALTGPQLVRYMVTLAPGVDPKKVERAIDAVSLAVKAPARYAGAQAGHVIIEVNRDRADVVSLRDVIQRSVALIRLGVPLGIAADCEPLTARLADMPHMLVAGVTGAGKSEFLTSTLTSLLLRNTPDDMRLWLIDPKRVELAAFADAPHVTDLVTEVSHAGPALRRLVDIMNARYAVYKAAGVRSFEEYNAQAEDGLRQARQVLVVDELADLILSTKVCEPFLVKLATLGRAAGIHMMLATQHPEAKVITAQLRLNVPARVVFAVANHTASGVALGESGAEKLRGQGDGLYKAPRMGKPVRFQAPLVPRVDVVRVVSWWVREQDRRPGPAELPSPQAVDAPVDNPELRAEVDAWFEEARRDPASAAASLTPYEVLGDAGFTPAVVEALGEILAPQIAAKVAEHLAPVVLSDPVTTIEGETR